MSALVALEGVSVRYPARRRVIPGTGAIIGAKIVEQPSGARFYEALSDVSVSVSAGETVGLIGLNGAGKSTLLQVMGGIIHPDAGTVQVAGRASCLFTSARGLNADETLRHNLDDATVLMGVPWKQRRSVVEDVLDFAEVEAFLDEPLRVMSAGMRARIGFGLVTAVPAEVLLVDEVFGAGDIRFQKKARERLHSHFRQSSAMVLASHAPSVIKQFCTHALLMDRGQVAARGEVGDILSQYEALVASLK